MWDLRKAKRADAGGAAAAAGEEPAALPVLRTWLAHDKDINSVAVSPNDALVATGSADRSVRLWDPSTGGRLPGPSPAPSPFARARRSPPVLSSPLLSSSLRPSECEACDCGVGRPFLRRPLSAGAGGRRRRRGAAGRVQGAQARGLVRQVLPRRQGAAAPPARDPPCLFAGGWRARAVMTREYI